MNVAFLNALADYGGTLITHIALFDSGVEISGGSPAYARRAVTWTVSANGLIMPTGDLAFDVPGGATVDEWRGFTALSGGTDYEGDSVTPEVFGAQGVYTLIAATTNIDLDAA